MTGALLPGMGFVGLALVLVGSVGLTGHPGRDVRRLAAALVVAGGVLCVLKLVVDGGPW